MKKTYEWLDVFGYTILSCIIGAAIGVFTGIIMMATETRNLPSCKTRIDSSLVINEVEYKLIEKKINYDKKH